MPVVRTVLGDVPTDDLALVLPHEHVLVDLEWPEERHTFDAVLSDRELAASELEVLPRALGDWRVVLVDTTTPDIGRDPAALRDLSLRTRTHVVMGCGWYRQPYYGPDVDASSTASLTERLLREIESGTGPHGTRPGVIGELGSHKGYVTAQEERVFRAAARAARRSGLAVTTHSVPDQRSAAAGRPPVGLAHLDLLVEEGVAASRVAVGHCDTWLDAGYLREITDRGAYVQFDNVGEPAWGGNPAAARRLADVIEQLCHAGATERVLLSQDVCRRSYLTTYGGGGYGYLLAEFLPSLRARGFTDGDIRTLTLDNPLRLLEVHP